jgi:2-oxoglutarate ferredoxin oxidoreductase subunit beta
LNPLSLLLEAGASFVARGYAGKIDHLSEVLTDAIMHEGFSVVDVLQPSVVFNDTYKLYNEITEVVSKPADSFEDAVKLVKKMNKKLPIGVFYKVKKPVFHKELYGSWNPVKKKQSKKERLKTVEEFLQP